MWRSCTTRAKVQKKIFLDHFHYRHTTTMMNFVIYTNVSNLKTNGLYLINRVLNTIVTSLGSISSKKWPYFFLTGSAGTGKSYLIKMIINWLDQHKNRYLLLAPTGVAAQNIGGFTIHSALRITRSESGFRTLAYYDSEFKNELLKIQKLKK